MGKLLARFVSVVFHPLFIPLYCVLIIFNSPVYIIYQLNIDTKYAVCAVVAVFTIVLPAVSTVMLLKMDGIKSLKMISQEERKLPFIMSAIFYATLFLLKHNKCD